MGAMMQSIHNVCASTLLAFSASLLVTSGAPVLGQQASAPSAPQDAPSLSLVFEEIVTLGKAVHPGNTPFGERSLIPITGGTVAGPQIKGIVLPGGWDWQLATPNQCNSLHADYMIQTDDGVVINIVNVGKFCHAGKAQARHMVTTPSFEAPLGKYEWLNSGAYVGILEGTRVNRSSGVRIRIYRVE